MVKITLQQVSQCHSDVIDGVKMTISPGNKKLAAKAITRGLLSRITPNFDQIRTQINFIDPDGKVYYNEFLTVPLTSLMA